MPLSIGDLLNNRYRIQSILGQGGMGAVYHAFDENLHMYVAVKENLFLSDEYSRQFQREASILANLRHPNLPRVIDYFVIREQGQYLIMDYIQGEDLRHRLERSQQIPETEAVAMGIAICDALTYLHSMIPPVIHRDLKPGNIRISPKGELYLVDFGLAKLLSGNQTTSTGARAMTPGYSPPEQYGTAPTDSRTDIYSLGATLYAAITGTIPEDGLARATGKAKLTPLRRLRPSISKPIALVIERSMEIEPEDRFQNAEAFKQALLDASGIQLIPGERITISPAPSNEATPASSSMLQDPNPSKGRGYTEPIGSRPTGRPSLLRWLWVAIPTFLVALIAGFFILNPSLAMLSGAALTPSQTALPATHTTIPTRTPRIVPSATQRQLLPTSGPTQISETLPSPATLAPTQQGGGKGQIAFASDRNGMMQLWLSNANGSNLTQLTNEMNGACQPAWSPDGQRLAFISPCTQKEAYDYSGARIYLLDMKTRAIEPLGVPADPAGDFDPAFSPDGKKIAFTSLRNGLRANIYIFDLQSQELRNISENKVGERQPAWSTDGQQIVYVKDSKPNELWTVNVFGEPKPQRFISSPEHIYSRPTWSNDDRQIFFIKIALSTGFPRVYSLRYESRNLNNAEIRIPRAEPNPPLGAMASIAISPDGSWFAFEGWKDDQNHNIYLMTSSGLNSTPLLDEPSFEFGPAWRP